jgi:hypothetical protein
MGESSGGKNGVPPPTTIGLTNSRYSSISPSPITPAARVAPPTPMSLPGRSRRPATSSAMPWVASRALPCTSVSVLENTTFSIELQASANSSRISPGCSSVSHGTIAS